MILKQNRIHISLMTAILLFIIVVQSCRNEEIYRIIKIQTDEIVNITDTSAVAFGIIIDLGEGVSKYGFCWNSIGDPTIDDDVLEFENAKQTGNFTGIISGLTGGENYYINTYALTGELIIYGEQKVFTCLKGLPKVITGELTNIGKASVQGQGIITNDGGNTILSKGYLWSRTEDPVLGRYDGFTTDTSQSNTFINEISNLIPDNKFYLRAYATNENGTGYGEVKTIQTLPPESGDLMWAKYFGSYNNEENTDACIDDEGNLYITGRFLEYTTLGNFTLNSAGGHDIFIAKINSEGEVLWAKSAGGSGEDNCYNICSDNSGNLIITGSFESSATFDTQILTSAGQKDIFLVKYDTNGNIDWAQRNGNVNNDIGYGVEVDENDNIYFTGYKSGSVTFGTFTLVNYTVFTAMCSADGTVQWASELDQTESFKICIDNSANVYILGRQNAPSLPGSYSYDIFLAKYNSDGAWQWNYTIGDDWESDYDLYEFETPWGMVCDNTGNVYITGRSNWNVFISKYNSVGGQIWEKSFIGANEDISSGIDIDATGNLHIIGNFASPKLILETDTITNSAYQDIFYSKYDSEGNIISLKSYNGAVDDIGSAICITPDYIYQVGYANSRFLELDYFTIENTGRNDLIIAKIKQ